jgi:hypothetical protein
MAAITIAPNPAHPYNDPTHALFRRNMIYTLGDTGIGNGLSWSYQTIRRSAAGHDGASASQVVFPTSRPGIVISTAAYETNFSEYDVRKWNPQLKSALGDMVERGYLVVKLGGVVQTADQVRQLV